MNWYEPEDPIVCPDCHGDDTEDCLTCEETGYVSRSDYRTYLADGRADAYEDDR